MRSTVLAVVLALGVALAGCADDAPPPATTSPTPTPSPDVTPTPTTNATPTPTTPTTPPEEPKEAKSKEVVNDTFDFSSGQASGPDGKVVSFEVPAGYDTITFNASIEKKTVSGLPDASLSANQKLSVLDPSGTVVLTLNGLPSAKSETVAATAGTWSIKYEGTASAIATVTGVAYG